MSESFYFEPILKSFVSGHDFSRAAKAANDEGFSPCGSISLSILPRAAFGSSSCRWTLPLQHSLASVMPHLSIGSVAVKQ
jgi:hypothetical protein